MTGGGSGGAGPAAPLSSEVVAELVADLAR
jgi:hypothetical protein